MTSKDYIKQAYCEAMLDLCEEKDINKITVNDVVERVGTARQTFYNRFHDINDLICHVHIQYTEDSYAREPDPRVALCNVFLFALEHKAFYRQLPFHSAQNCFRDTFLQWCIDSSSKLVNLDRSDDDYSRKQTAIYLYSAGVAELFLEWCRGGMTSPYELVVDAIMEAEVPFS